MLRPSVQVLTPPASEPVTAAELAAHLKLNTGTAEYSDLSAFIASARALFELHTGRAVLPTTFRQWMPTLSGSIELLRGSVTSVTGVSYYDADDDLVEDLDGILSDLTGTPAMVYLPDSDWPALSARRTRPAYVDFVAGWSNAAAVPALAKTAIKLMAGHWYRFRENYTEVPLKELPSGFRVVVDLFDTGLTRGA